MRKKERPARVGQIGNYWLSKLPARQEPADSWYRTWYHAAARRTCRASLGTGDLHEASKRLARYVVENERPTRLDRGEIFIDEIITRYWKDEFEGKERPSEATERLALEDWRAFWTGRTVAEITPAEQRRFREKLQGGLLRSDGRPRKLSPGGLDRILSAGRAALNHAKKNEIILSVPHIFMTQSKEEKRSRDPKGRPLSIDELASLFDAAVSQHAFMYLMLAVGTLARPGAILELTRTQYDAGHERISLNPPGRKQTKKYRPIIPAVPTIRPWLATVGIDEEQHYVTYRGEPIASIYGIFRRLKADTKLKGAINPYSIRHTMGRELRKRNVPTEQIALFLGHEDPDDHSGTTTLYAPYEPQYLAAAVSAIEDVFRELRSRLKGNLELDPQAIFASEERPTLVRLTGKAMRRGIGEAKRQEVRRLILARVPHRQIVEQSKVSSGTVSEIRQRIRAETVLLKITR